ncbi:MAG: ABC transporter substrate-binding protein, partial [Oscillospiraceae bacterium]|nr:ABC transporter substrate-binding protein [Oscillospiraceae bacterium]
MKISNNKVRVLAFLLTVSMLTGCGALNNSQTGTQTDGDQTPAVTESAENSGEESSEDKDCCKDKEDSCCSEGADCCDDAEAALAGIPEKTNINIGYLNSTAHLLAFVAAEEGYFSEEGLNVTLTQFSSAAELVNGLESDKLDLAFIGSVPTLTFQSQGH